MSFDWFEKFWRMCEFEWVSEFSHTFFRSISDYWLHTWCDWAMVCSPVFQFIHSMSLSNSTTSTQWLLQKWWAKSIQVVLWWIWTSPCHGCCAIILCVRTKALMYASLLKFDLHCNVPSAAVAYVLVRIIHYTTIQSFCILILCERYPILNRPKFPSLLSGTDAGAFNRHVHDLYALHFLLQHTNCVYFWCNKRVHNHRWPYRAGQ